MKSAIKKVFSGIICFIMALITMVACVACQPTQSSSSPNTSDTSNSGTGGNGDSNGGGDVTANPDAEAVLVNQIGYDVGTSKRATIPNVQNGKEFKVIKKSDGSTAYSGTVNNGIADFSSLNPSTDTDYYIVCDEVKSYDFTIGINLLQRRTVTQALAFMNETRSDTTEWGSNSIAWRDSHQFSFELNGLVLQYMANPSLYDNLPYGIKDASSCEYEELRVQDEPDIVWMIQFAALRYYDWGAIENRKLHMLTKEQLAYFLYIYPEISEYVDEDMYVSIRDFTISAWGVETVHSGSQWYAVEGTNHNLYGLQTVFGGLKGSQPPGHSIVPNLMMYEVANRDGLGEEVAEDFFQAAYDNAEYLVDLDRFDLNDPYYNKGQRMSEYITIPALAYFVEMYPDEAPEGIVAAIQRWATTNIARSNNMWDMRMAVSEAAGDYQYYFHNPTKKTQRLSKDYWTGAAYANADDQAFYLAGGAPKNEPGNQAGFQAVTYAAARVLGDNSTSTRLKGMGVSAIDDLYGRNPSGRAAFYHFTRDFEGADLGWYMQYPGGAGVLGGCTAVIDANAPEGCYPYNPSAYNTGYTEGWVSYNTAWNASLAYAAADAVSMSVETSSITDGERVTVTLIAPINMNPNVQETGTVIVIDADAKERTKVVVTEDGVNSNTFIGSFDIATGARVKISYGSGLFRQTKAIRMEADEEIQITPKSNKKEILSFAIGEETATITKQGQVTMGQIDMYDANVPLGGTSTKTWQELGSLPLVANRTTAVTLSAIGESGTAGKFRLAAEKIRLTDSGGNTYEFAARDVFMPNGSATQNEARPEDGLWLVQNYSTTTWLGTGNPEGCSVKINLNVETTDVYKLEIYTWNNQDGGIYQAVYDMSNMVTIEVPSGTNLASVTPDVSVSEKAMYTSGEIQELTNGAIQLYTVTAENGTKATYVIIISYKVE